MTTEENEPCDHHWLTDVQLGEYVECELCGLIFLRKDWGKTEAELKKKIMTTKEINKAVEEYAESLKSIAFEDLSGEETPYLLRGAFKEGLESANKHWQEKTRWIPVEERLPEIKVCPYQILVKNESISTMYIASQHDIDLLRDDCLGFNHWKEIE